MTTAKSCCFIQDKNIEINNKTAKRKATWIFPIFWTDKPSFFRGFSEESESRLFSLVFCYLGINTSSLCFLNFNFEIAGQKLEGIQKHFQLASYKFSPIESHFHQVYV